MFFNLSERIDLNLLQLKNLGFWSAVKFKFYRFFQRFNALHQSQSFYLTSKYAKHPLAFRPKTTDLNVFHQIFIEREYALLDSIQNVGLIIDCGANVGYSSAYFLTHFPESTLIAVEPGASNFTTMKKNLDPYGDRVKVIHSGIWSHNANLKISETPFRDCREWAIQVRECYPDETPDFQAKDIFTLLEESGNDRVSILKIDIEGAEAVVFRSNYSSWLERVDNIVIELHDDTAFGSASEIFFSAIKDRAFDISHHGELVLCRSQSISQTSNHPKDYFSYR
jgi:FkbM family methyltransferase